MLLSHRKGLDDAQALTEATSALAGNVQSRAIADVALLDEEKVYARVCGKRPSEERQQPH